MNEENIVNQPGMLVESTVSNKETKVKRPSNEIKRKCRKERPNNDAKTTIKETFNFLAFFGKVLGWECTYEWKTNPRHWLTTIDIVFMWYHMIYSQIEHFMTGEYGRIFEIFACYGISVSCVLKFWWYLKYFREITALHNFSARIIRQASRQMTEKLQHLELLKQRIAQFLGFSAAVSTAAYLFNPVQSVINRDKGEMVSLLPYEISFTDQSTLSGYLVANACMSIMGVYAVFISLFVVLHFITIILNYSVQVDIIEVDVKQLDEFWRDHKKTTVERHLFLRNICQKCQDKDNYMREVKRIFDRLIFSFFCGAYLSQVLCLYEVQVKNWMSGYGIAYGLFTEMLLYCYFGTKAVSINERLCYVLTQSNWYTYDIYSQKIFLHLLISCMNAKELWIGPLAPLSFFTGIQIVKNIYTYYAFLAEAA
ncbi:odorant receptor 67d-like isoform X1 [Bradysia coprophila]|uniref:odorant receptor 67d-like isoform X1 n=1 Tax=Bradysia coprophila TaxID=38358 RepID=UPI00187DC5DF|nr:odorant receptor 67d-like isoform X1 [Bradysia coprophila]